MLEIKNLTVKKEGKVILEDINLKIAKGKKMALFGPNGSGKSSLAYTILGIKGYKVVKGKILLFGKDITKVSPENRVKLGLALAFQHPPEIEGLSLKNLLENISKGFLEKRFLADYENILKRDINKNLSGGEKKVSELLQILALKPKLAIFDEIDSGLDIEKFKEASKLIKEELLKSKTSLLLISHSGKVLEYFKPDEIYILIKGKIVCHSKNWQKVWKTIKKYGYKKCEKCQLSANR